MQYHTYFPVGQSYEIRLLDNRKKGEMPELNNKTVKVRDCAFYRCSVLGDSCAEVSPASLFSACAVMS